MSKPSFDYIIIFFILVSSVHLALDRPLLDKNSSFKKALHVIDILLTVVFSLEAVLKIFGFGIYFSGRRSYFRSSWNLLDFIVVIFSVIYSKYNI